MHKHLFERPEYPDSGRELVLDWVPIQASRILDVGCNMGRFGELLKSRQRAEVWGVEPDADSAKVAVTRLDRVIVDYFDSNLELPTGYFDVVTFNDSLEHMPNPERALRVALSVLRSGGLLLCTVPNVRHIDTVEQLIFEGEWRYETFGVRDNTHLRFFTAKSLCRTVSEVGFIVERIQFVGEDWWHAKKWFRRLLFKIASKMTYEFRYAQVLLMATKASSS